LSTLFLFVKKIIEERQGDAGDTLSSGVIGEKNANYCSQVKFKVNY